mmetsp:Transcript_40217/g.48734  ORF Transcript_40217/g.48734 Transcript_40217/m.48734 type:complete len:214 (+) Transcript_40217:159-800(+)|eukprot:CAMPEP_0197848678 /NCGR_PEP_ID=MMETSP1438-20131217/9592_1 /TAXON_ID=1461541 /ORGANISM="Pterosperma sp., Strain CCMP1384" /LENGTH=213 /DNA_ID=CAMNT_0043461041 /DNA_START=157 /DNA_END=798 /DNA_ORIENTATION=+
MEWVQSGIQSVVDAVTGSGSEITEEQLKTFLQQAFKKMKSEGFQDELREVYSKGGNREQNVMQHIDNAQKDIFNNMGIDGNFGVQYLKGVYSKYANNAEIRQIFEIYLNSEQEATYAAEYEKAAWQQLAMEMNTVKQEMNQVQKQMMEKMQSLPQQEQMMMAQDMQQKSAMWMQEFVKMEGLPTMPQELKPDLQLKMMKFILPKHREVLGDGN